MGLGQPGFWGGRSRSGIVTILVLDLLRQFPDGIALPVLSILSQTLARSPMLSFLLSWGVIAVVLGHSMTYVYPDELDLWNRHPGLGTLFVAFALAHAISFTRFSDSPLLFVAIALVFAGSVGAIVWYFQVRADWELRDPTGEGATLVENYVPGMVEELRGERRHDGLRRTVGVAVWLVAFGFIFALPCFVAGLVANLLANAFPVPDLLLLSVVVTQVVASSESISFRPPSKARLDVEVRLYDTVTNSLRNTKGMMLVVVTVFGGVLSARLLSMTVGLLPTIRGALAVAVPAAPLLAWNYVGVVVALVASAVYGVWYWLRQLERIGPFLDLWEDSPRGVSGPTRPRGLTIPPVLSFLAVVGFFAGIDANVERVRVAFALAWPASVALLVGCVVWTARTPTQLPTDEDRTVVVSAAMPIASTWIGGNADALVAGSVSTAALTNLVFSVLGIVALVYLPNAVEGEWTLGVGKYAVVLYLLAFSVLAGVSAIVGDAPMASMYAALAAACVVGAVALAVVKRIES